MITKRISGQQKQPGSFILQAGPLSRSYHVAESICRIYNSRGADCLSNVGVYLPCTVLQGCRLFKQCLNLPVWHCVAVVQAD